MMRRDIVPVLAGASLSLALGGRTQGGTDLVVQALVDQLEVAADVVLVRPGHQQLGADW